MTSVNIKFHKSKVLRFLGELVNELSEVNKPRGKEDFTHKRTAVIFPRKTSLSLRVLLLATVTGDVNRNFG
jgi:hypothetical protein